MPLEIERKFLVTGDAWRTQASGKVEMAQAYLNDLATLDAGAMNVSVRVRLQGTEAFLNMKSRELGTTRQEFDYPIPVDDARALLKLAVGGRIEKVRHYVVFGGHTFGVDEFLGENAGLVVAELELDDADAVYQRPDWLGAEVTHDSRYYNLALASRPYSTW
ncbi:CYTH domain-containing protein [Cognatilysobacter lacus]|uniref:CYTH domain-containing protein n=1 Tax=Cognatilysobacter lacus TaxID=1643323 RepID=A0A5D8YZN0_9GAMM|nr:CYTH domain-containing protein [Lysobacter lacus]TZF88188.1 CYTH domain-containing protein [Lysobacter lacus]